MKIDYNKLIMADICLVARQNYKTIRLLNYKRIKIQKY